MVFLKKNVDHVFCAEKREFLFRLRRSHLSSLIRVLDACGSAQKGGKLHVMFKRRYSEAVFLDEGWCIKQRICDHIS